MGFTAQRSFFSSLTDPVMGGFFWSAWCRVRQMLTGISPHLPFPIQGELSARLGLKFPVNFLVFINSGAVSKVKEDHNTIHGELHNLEDESKKGNGMKFKTTKCKVIHLGINKKFCSKLWAHQLETREEQKDVSVSFNQRMSTSQQWVDYEKAKVLASFRLNIPSSEQWHWSGALLCVMSKISPR